MYVIAYDISNNRRRTRFHKKLLNYGQPVQLSVFEIEDDCLGNVLATCASELKEKDRVRIYRVCKRCAALTQIIGPGAGLLHETGAEGVIEVPSRSQATLIASKQKGSRRKKEAYTRKVGPMETAQVLPGSRMMEAVCAMDNLNEAFLDVKVNRGAAGSDGVSVNAFDRKRNESLAALQREILIGQYRPGVLRVVEIPKKSGGSRVLRIPCVRDRVAQQAVLRIIGPRWEREFEEASFAYRKGRSVKQAVNRVRRLRDEGRPWVLRSDVEDYFDTIPHQKVLERFAAIIPDDQLCALVALWLNTPLGAPCGAGNRGVPQGSCISPLLSNIYLDRFDEAMIAKGYRVVRYADDFVVVCRSEEEALRARDEVQRELEADDLKMNVEKTAVVSFNKGFTFLGYLFIGSFAVKTTLIPSSWKVTGLQ